MPEEHEVLKDFKGILEVIAHWMAIPLFLLFWGADILYVPEKKYLFLVLRFSIVPICFFTSWAITRTDRLKFAERIACSHAIAMASVINIMIFFIKDPGTPYYAGLNLVAIGELSFLPFSIPFYAITATGIYLPYYLISLSKAQNYSDFQNIILNSFFILGTITICLLIRFFHQKSRKAEIQARHDLNVKATELKATLDQLQMTQSDLVESARMASIGTLSAGVAHEINNSMNFIHQSIPLLKNHLQRLDDPEDSFEILDILNEGVERSVDIVKALRTQTGSGSNSIKLTNIAESVKATLSLLGKRLRDKNIQVHLKLPEIQDLNTYPGILAQTLTNLITNAIDAIPANHQGRIDIEFVFSGIDIQLSVKDNGSGMPQELQTRIFDPFFSTKGPQHGNGLGLYIVKNNLKHINGEIICRSQPGGPTEFKVKIPIVSLQIKEISA